MRGTRFRYSRRRSSISVMTGMTSGSEIQLRLDLLIAVAGRSKARPCVISVPQQCRREGQDDERSEGLDESCTAPMGSVAALCRAREVLVERSLTSATGRM